MQELLFGRRYRATEKIGTGGMADVYRAVDEVLGRPVAVKVMHARFASDPEFTARFRQEAQAAANLVSPNIVNMYDWGQDGDTYYIVMEFVRGSDLKVVERKGALPSVRVAEIGAQVCSALTVAHGYDVIHRDIKPHNIMVQPDGSVKVMDFGIARAGNTTMTQTGSVLGTAQYISPEQAQGKPLTAGSDLYSLGVVLYEAATGQLPFDADTPVAVALMQVNEQALAPRTLNPDIAADLEAVIVKAMQKNPADRYVSADDMRRDLRAVVQSRPIEGAIAAAGVGADAGAAGAGAGVAAGAGAAASAAAMPGVAATAAHAQTSVLPRADKTAVMQPVAKTAVMRPAAAALAAAAPTAALLTAPIASGLEAPARSARPQRGGAQPSATRATTRRRSAWLWMLVAALLAVAALGLASSAGLIGGARSASVPNVSAKTRAGALSAIKDAGFTAGRVVEGFSERVKAGSVASQSPAPSSTAEAGSAVSLVISKGPEKTAIPDVVGMIEAEAFKVLRDAGFNPQALPSEFNSEIAANTVIRQTAANVKAVKGSIVDYVLSRGAQPFAPGWGGKGNRSGKSKDGGD